MKQKRAVLHTAEEEPQTKGGEETLKPWEAHNMIVYKDVVLKTIFNCSLVSQSGDLLF